MKSRWESGGRSPDSAANGRVCRLWLSGPGSRFSLRSRSSEEDHLAYGSCGVLHSLRQLRVVHAQAFLDGKQLGSCIGNGFLRTDAVYRTNNFLFAFLRTSGGSLARRQIRTYRPKVGRSKKEERMNKVIGIRPNSCMVPNVILDDLLRILTKPELQIPLSQEPSEGSQTAVLVTIEETQLPRIVAETGTLKQPNIMSLRSEGQAPVMDGDPRRPDD